MKKDKLQGINVHLLKYYFDDRNKNNKVELDEIKDNVNGFDLSVNKEINDKIQSYNQSADGEYREKEYIFFTFQGRRYGTFLFVHSVKEEKTLIKELKTLKCSDVCIIFGKK